MSTSLAQTRPVSFSYQPNNQLHDPNRRQVQKTLKRKVPRNARSPTQSTLQITKDEPTEIQEDQSLWNPFNDPITKRETGHSNGEELPKAEPKSEKEVYWDAEHESLLKAIIDPQNAGFLQEKITFLEFSRTLDKYGSQIASVGSSLQETEGSVIRFFFVLLLLTE